MRLFVKCPQGHKIAAKVKLAGKQVKCPKCGSAVQIPEQKSREVDAERSISRKPAARVRKSEKNSSSNISKRSILTIAGGTVAGLLMFGLLAWGLFGKSVDDPPTIADNNVAQSEGRSVRNRKWTDRPKMSARRYVF